MNRKFINAFFAAALLLGSATVFSSCKDTNEDMRTDLEASLNRTKAGLESRLAALEGKIPDNLSENISNLLNLQGITQPVLDAIAQQIDELEKRAEVSVTSVVLQSVENPVFGSISLPVDVKSNMLLTYYGAFDEMKFPSVKSAGNIGDVLTASEVADEVTVGGEVTAKADGVDGAYLGTVYTTINPSSVDAASDAIEWSLVNSQDEEYGEIKLENIKPSDKVLEFGLGSRAGNGFYEATAVANDLDAIKYEIVDGLAESVKDALTSPTKQDVKDLAQLVIAQLRKNDFPALGVKAAYSWNNVDFKYKLDPAGTPQQWVLDGEVTTTAQNAAAYSEYAIAAAAFKPLSFNFLAGQSLDKFPTLPDLGNYELSKEEFDINITAPDKSNFTAEVSFGPDETIIFEIPEQTVTVSGGDGGTVTVPATQITAKDLETLKREMQESLQNSMDNSYNAIADMVIDINKQIDNVFKKVNDKIQAATGKVQGWIDRANNVINQVNNLLSNPNHYLQVCALYENGDKIGRLSNTKAIPTYFPGGGASTLNVILTTYNLETICPAYMKYYAVYKEGKAEPVAHAVIPGTTSRVAISGLEDDATYKVVYQALDYHGKTSTQKFYFQIGE